MADLVYLVRHAAPPPERLGRYWGRKDPGLDAVSLAGITTLPTLMWRPPTRLMVSPLLRAMATAAPLADRFNLEPQVVPGLAEADFGALDGLTFDEFATRCPDAARKWGDVGDNFVFPDGEAITVFLSRAAAAWESCQQVSDDTIAVVTHGGIIAAWCCLFLRMALEHRFSFRPSYASLTAFMRKKDGSGWELICFNDTA